MAKDEEEERNNNDMNGVITNLTMATVDQFNKSLESLACKLQLSEYTYRCEGDCQYYMTVTLGLRVTRKMSMRWRAWRRSKMNNLLRDSDRREQSVPYKPYWHSQCLINKLPAQQEFRQPQHILLTCQCFNQ